MLSEKDNLAYLCVLMVLLFTSYKFLNSVRKVKPKPISMNILSNFSKRLIENMKILENTMSGKQRSFVNKQIKKIKGVLNNPAYFTKPCFDHEKMSQETLDSDHKEIQKLVQPLRDMEVSPRIKIILDEIANDYEALINLSRNSFCQKI